MKSETIIALLYDTNRRGGFSYRNGIRIGENGTRGRAVCLLVSYVLVLCACFFVLCACLRVV